MKKLITAMTLILAIGGWATAQTPMIRLSVQESSLGDEPTAIELTLPLTMLQAMKPTIQEALQNIDMETEGHLDIYAIWQEIKNVGPNEYVTIEDGNETVRVFTTETHLMVNVNQSDGEIELSVPLAVVDAILGQEEMDVEALIATLESMQGQDLVTVVGTDVNVRVWIE